MLLADVVAVSAAVAATRVPHGQGRGDRRPAAAGRRRRSSRSPRGWPGEPRQGRTGVGWRTLSRLAVRPGRRAVAHRHRRRRGAHRARGDGRCRFRRPPGRAPHPPAGGRDRRRAAVPRPAAHRRAAAGRAGGRRPRRRRHGGRGPRRPPSAGPSCCPAGSPRPPRPLSTGGVDGARRGAARRWAGRSGRCWPAPAPRSTPRWPPSAPTSRSSTSSTAPASRSTGTATTSASGPARCAR